MGRSRFPHITDEELVERALLGDGEAFDELVRRFRGAVTFVALQVLGRREAAEDVAQDAFLLAFRSLPQLADRRRFAGWLCAIARHRARRVAARDGRLQPTEPERLERLLLAGSEEQSPTAEEEWRRAEEGALLRSLLARLPPEHQAVLYLHYFEEWPARRIAGFLSLSLTTVQWRLHHGRRLLRRQLILHEEETRDERPEERERRGPPPLPDASPDGGDGPRGKHDREHGTGCAARGPAVQPCGPTP